MNCNELLGVVGNYDLGVGFNVNACATAKRFVRAIDNLARPGNLNFVSVIVGFVGFAGKHGFSFACFRVTPNDVLIYVNHGFHFA